MQSQLGPGHRSYVQPRYKLQQPSALVHTGMASPQGVTAIVQASRPHFRSGHDKLAFAVHAVLSLNGLRLIAVSDAADAPDETLVNEPDYVAPLDGWNQSSSCFSFLYALPCQAPLAAPSAQPPAKGGPTEPQPQRLLLKCLTMDTVLLATLSSEPSPEGVVPATLELPVEQFCGAAAPAAPAPAAAPASVATTSASTTAAATGNGTTSGSTTDSPNATTAVASLGYSYLQLPLLAEQVQAALAGQLAVQETGTAPAHSSQAKPTAPAVRATREGQGGPRTSATDPDPRLAPGPRPDPLRDYSQPGGPWGVGGPRMGMGADPLAVGRGDLEPGGFPGLGGGIGGLGAPPLRGGLGGSGMHMGPGHPAFAGRRGQPPPNYLPGLGGGVPGGPGVRWDPIAPEGLQGWRPDDFTRPGGPDGRRAGVHPDVMQPGPGRGVDWDEMFG